MQTLEPSSAPSATRAVGCTKCIVSAQTASKTSPELDGKLNTREFLQYLLTIIVATENNLNTNA